MSEFNSGVPVEVENIPKEKMYQAIHEWAEGSEVLEKCLITAYENGLKTKVCCRGYHEIENPDLFCFRFFNNQLDALALARLFCNPYIAFSKDSHIFGYLSNEFITNPNILLDSNEYNDNISFYGESCYELMQSLTDEIKSGKKRDNTEALLKKINDSGTTELHYNSILFAMKKSGFSDEQIECFKTIITLNAFTRSNPECLKQFDEFCDLHGVDESERKVILDYLKAHNFLGVEEKK